MKEAVETSILLFENEGQIHVEFQNLKQAKKTVQHFANHCLADAESCERHCRLQLG